MKRNTGIDLLRCISMFMIVILHLLWQGGIIKGCPENTINWNISWILRSLCLCATNCYAIISGIYLSEKTFKIQRLIAIWIQVVFYSLCITVAFSVIGNNLLLKPLLISFFPVVFRRYWYFTAYVGLLLMTPYLNILHSNMNKKVYLSFVALCFATFSLLPTIRHQDVFSLMEGYSPFWLMICYFIGGYIGKFVISGSKSVQRRKIGAFVYFGSSLSAFFSFFVFHSQKLSSIQEMFLMYTSPLIVIASIGMVVWFANIESIKNERLIPKIAKLTFGVYLIHTHPLVFEKIINDSMLPVIQQSPVLFVVSILMAAIIYSGLVVKTKFLTFFNELIQMVG